MTHYDDWYRQAVSYLAGELPDGEAEAFVQGLRDNVARQQTFDEVRAVFDATAHSAESDAFGTAGDSVAETIWPSVKAELLDLQGVTGAVRRFMAHTDTHPETDKHADKHAEAHADTHADARTDYSLADASGNGSSGSSSRTGGGDGQHAAVAPAKSTRERRLDAQVASLFKLVDETLADVAPRQSVWAGVRAAIAQDGLRAVPMADSSPALVATPPPASVRTPVSAIPVSAAPVSAVPVNAAPAEARGDESGVTNPAVSQRRTRHSTTLKLVRKHQRDERSFASQIFPAAAAVLLVIGGLSVLALMTGPRGYDGPDGNGGVTLVPNDNNAIGGNNGQATTNNRNRSGNGARDRNTSGARNGDGSSNGSSNELWPDDTTPWPNNDGAVVNGANNAAPFDNNGAPINNADSGSNAGSHVNRPDDNNAPANNADGNRPEMNTGNQPDAGNSGVVEGDDTPIPFYPDGSTTPRDGSDPNTGALPNGTGGAVVGDDRPVATGFEFLSLKYETFTGRSLPYELPRTPGQVILTSTTRSAQIALPTTTGRPVNVRLEDDDDQTIQIDANGDGVFETTEHGTAFARVKLQYDEGGEPETTEYRIRFNYDAAEKSWRAQSWGHMRTVTRNKKRRVMLYDGNLNGRYDDVGEDYIGADRASALTYLTDIVSLGGELIGLIPSASGTYAVSTPYHGPTAKIAIKAEFVAGTRVEKLTLRSDVCALTLTAPDDKPFTVPAGTYTVAHGVVSAARGRYRVYLTGDPVMADNGVPFPDTGAREVEVRAGETTAIKLGGELTLDFYGPIAANNDPTVFMVRNDLVMLRGQLGERYIKFDDSREGIHERTIAPEQVDLIDPATGNVIGRGMFRFRDEVSAVWRHKFSEAPAAGVRFKLIVTEERFSRILSGTPTRSLEKMFPE